MRIFKCNGVYRGSEKSCCCECKPGMNDKFPKGWLTISGIIVNDLPNARTITANDELHFCSRSCLSHYLFTTEPNTNNG